MAGLKDTKRRIISVKNTQKITKAMKLVSAAKYARANQAATNARPYGESFDELVKSLAAACGDDVKIPLLENREVKKALLVVVATDRGLCGGLNSNLFKNCTKFLEEQKKNGVTIELVAWGKRAAMYCKTRPEKLISSEEKVLQACSYEFAKENGKIFSNHFIEGQYDSISFAYSKFRNALTQIPTVAKILPAGIEETDEALERQFIFEPEMKTLLEGLLEKQVVNKIYRIFLEGSASEHASRMAAMDSATNNAQDVIKKLTLEYNRARQAAITSELIEITSGAEAL